jgi:two-component sensor histidine kinase
MLVSTLVLLGVILLVEGGVFFVSSRTVMSQSRVLIDLILDQGGDLPLRGIFSSSQETFLALNQESIFETRFFSARESGGTVSLVNMRLMGVTDEEALALAEKALSGSSAYGFSGTGRNRSLYYGIKTEEDGSVLVVFMDSASRMGLIRLIMAYTAAMWFVVLVLYILIMGRYSGRLIRPFVENDERQKRFITNASHELKTPLAVISANTEMTEAIGGKTKWTESTRRQTARLKSLIEDLVLLSRMDEMKDEDLADLCLSDIVSESAESFRSVAESEGKTFSLRVEPELHVRGDRRSLRQLSDVLVDNAVKYCDDGGSVSVSLSSKGRGKGAVLQVSNTYAEGKNVDCERFFERFYREDESHNSGKPGFGIGLSMAREFAERMNGVLKASCSNGTITFRLELRS